MTVVCTTDDPTDTLEHHQRIRKSDLGTRVYPTFRPDKALAVDQPAAFNAWVDKLSAVSGVDCRNLAGLLAALKQRHDFFHEIGCRLSDHGLSHCFADDCTADEAARTFDTARSGRDVTREEADKFRSFLMIYFGELDAARGWVKQLHLGALRNNNSRLARINSAPTPASTPSATGRRPQPLARYLDTLDSDNRAAEDDPLQPQSAPTTTSSPR